MYQPYIQFVYILTHSNNLLQIYDVRSMNVVYFTVHRVNIIKFKDYCKDPLFSE